MHKKPNSKKQPPTPREVCTMRDIFACGAIPALLEPGDSVSTYPQLADMAYAFADAMLAERTRGIQAEPPPAPSSIAAKARAPYWMWPSYLTADLIKSTGNHKPK